MERPADREGQGLAIRMRPEILQRPDEWRDRPLAHPLGAVEARVAVRERGEREREARNGPGFGRVHRARGVGDRLAALDRDLEGLVPLDLVAQRRERLAHRANVVTGIELAHVEP